MLRTTHRVGVGARVALSSSGDIRPVKPIIAAPQHTTKILFYLPCHKQLLLGDNRLPPNILFWGESPCKTVINFNAKLSLILMQNCH